MRAGFGTNNVDHCTRLCHASSVAGLLEGVGSGAVSAPFMAAEDADVIVVIGANPIENHPVAATFFKNAAERGAKLVVMDPRGQALKRHATHMLQFKPGRDVAMLNAMLHTIVEEELYDRQYVQANTEDFEKLVENVRDFPPEKMAAICGIPAATLREVARLYARAEAAIIFWGMGVSQHVHGTDNTRCLIALALVDRPDRPARHGPPSAARPEQRAGRLRRRPHPDVLPRLQVASRTPRRAASTRTSGARSSTRSAASPSSRSWTRCMPDKIRGMYIMGENPAMSDPDVQHAREALAKLEHLVVQDIFLTETAKYADVVLPASAWPEKDGTVTNTNRQVQMGRKALPLPGEARQDLDIIIDLAQRGSASAGATRSQRGLRRDGTGDAVARQHHLGAAGARKLGHLPVRLARRARPRHRLRRRLPDGERSRQVRAGAGSCRRPRSRMRNTRSCSRPAGSSSTGTRAR